MFKALKKHGDKLVFVEAASGMTKAEADEWEDDEIVRLGTLTVDGGYNIRRGGHGGHGGEEWHRRTRAATVENPTWMEKTETILRARSQDPGWQAKMRDILEARNADTDFQANTAHRAKMRSAKQGRDVPVVQTRGYETALEAARAAVAAGVPGTAIVRQPDGTFAQAGKRAPRNRLRGREIPTWRACSPAPEAWIAIPRPGAPVARGPVALALHLPAPSHLGPVRLSA